jgi:parallel beta-helix repeat protein
LWDRSLNPTTFGYYLSETLGNPAATLLMLVGVPVLSALAAALTSHSLLAKKSYGGRSHGRTVLLAVALLFLVALGGNVWVWASAEPSSPTPGDPAACTYDLFLLDGNQPIAWSVRGHYSTSLPRSDRDLGALVSSLPLSNQVLCFAAGHYMLASSMRIFGKDDVSLWFAKGATMTAVGAVGLLFIVRSSGVTVTGGEWVGSGLGNASDIEIDRGSNHVVIQDTDVSRAGHDGILVHNDTTPDLQVSILDNYAHDNGRFGIQDFEHVTTKALSITISGNKAEDNGRGGIYTNGVGGGAEIVGNTVGNTRGKAPGQIGIGVTNGSNDTVVDNRVENMSEYGIQVYFNNDTLVANNFSSFNAGTSDQSGITNDHSYYDTIVNNTVLSNGETGIYLERSWYLTVRGNNATGNGRFGISFFHGNLSSMAHETVMQNACSDNGQAGIIMNSGIDSVVSSNTCLDNSGPGILLYNDPGQLGSSDNVIANNSLGDSRPPPARTQTYGIQAVNAAENNTVVGNDLFNNTISNISLVGSANSVKGNVESPALVGGAASPPRQMEGRAIIIATGETLSQPPP